MSPNKKEMKIVQSGSGICIQGAMKGWRSREAEEGQVILSCDVEGASNQVELGGVLCDESLRRKLISVRKLCKAGARVVFEGDDVIVTKNHAIPFAELANDGELVMQGEVDTTEMYALKEASKRSAEANNAELQLWHDRLGHASKERLMQLSNKKMVEGLKLPECDETLKECEAVWQARWLGTVSRMSRPKLRRRQSVNSSTAILWVRLILCRLAAVVIALDLWMISHFSWVFLAKEKSQACDFFREVVAKLEARGHRVMRFRSDSAPELVRGEMEAFMKEKEMR